MREELRKRAEEELLELPVIQYAWIEPEQIPFSRRVREICREECPRYGTSWSCPPGVGTVEECRSRCAACSGGFVFSTAAEVADMENMEELLATRQEHEEVTAGIRRILGRYCRETLALSGESCSICEACTYPAGSCRHPDRMIPCLEGYGIVVPLLAEQAGIDFQNGPNVVTWFGLVLFME